MSSDAVKELLQKVYFGNSAGAYLASAGIFLASFAFLSVMGRLLLHRLESWAARTETRLDDILLAVIHKSYLPLLLIGSVHLALRGLSVHASLTALVHFLWMVCVTLFAVRIVSSLLVHALTAGKTGGSQAVSALLPVLKISLWALGIIFLLDNLGVKISAVVAGLGIGGVAVALAAQAVLGDLFSYFAILLDEPFAIGDFIVVDDLKGHVEHVGIKTTRVRSLSGEVLVFPNSSLTGSRIRNYQSLKERRVLFRFGLLCETPVEKLKQVPALVRARLLQMKEIRFERAHFAAVGESSMDFEVVYFVLTADYNRHMDIQQEINFGLLEDMQERGLSFAYPTRTVYTIPAGVRS